MISSVLSTTAPPPPGLTRPLISPDVQPDEPSGAVPTVDQATDRATAEVTETGAPALTGARPNLAPETAGDLIAGRIDGDLIAGRTDGDLIAGRLVDRPAETTAPAPQAAPNRSRELSGDLSPEERARVQQLQQIDREVRAHEQAHARVGGDLAGPPQYEFVTGPDGRQYAVAGSVEIRTSAPANASAAERVAVLEQVIRAALAPAEPSSQDRAIAARAEAELAQARADLRTEQAAEREADLEAASPDPDNGDSGGDIIGDTGGDAGAQPDAGTNLQAGREGIGEAGQSPIISPLLALQEAPEPIEPEIIEPEIIGPETSEQQDARNTQRQPDLAQSGLTPSGLTPSGLTTAFQTFTGSTGAGDASAGILDLFV